MGCGATLFLGSGGYVTCSWVECPNPTAASDLLGDREVEHIVEFGLKTFTIRHPLRERLNEDLMVCGLYDHIVGLDGPPIQMGRYRARRADGRWHWETLP